MRNTASLQHSRLALWRGRAIGGAGSLTFAAVLACVLCIASALTLAIVLALAGVLGGSRGLVLRHQEHTGLSRSAVLSIGLRVKANRRTAKKTSECGREGEVVCGIDFHWEHLSWFGRARFAGRNEVVASIGAEPLDALVLTA